MPVRIYGDGEIDGLTTFEANTFEVTNLKNTANAGDPNIVLGDDGSVQMTGLQYPTAGPLSNRNLIINGAMAVAQRGTSSNLGAYQTVDRWDVQLSGGTFTQSQETLATTDLPFTQDGHRYAVKIANDTNTTADASFRNFVTTLEAQDIAKCGWDYTSASSFVTLSFWVKSSVSQEFYASLRTSDGTEQNYVFSFTPAAGTWTKVTKTIPGNANLQFDLNAEQGLSVNIAAWWGTTYTSPSVSTDTWQAWSGGLRFPDMTDTWANTLDSTFEITGVQLEVGSKATPFEHRPYGTELALCQRYYEKGDSRMLAGRIDTGSTYFSNYWTHPFKATKRANPTMVVNMTSGSTFGWGSTTEAINCTGYVYGSATGNTVIAGDFTADAEL